MDIQQALVFGFIEETAKIAAEIRTSVIGGKRIRERRGALTEALGEKPSEASKAKLTSYVRAAKSPAERKKRMAQINLARAHMKGVKAKTGKAPSIPDVEPGEGSIKKEGFFKGLLKRVGGKGKTMTLKEWKKLRG